MWAGPSGRNSIEEKGGEALIDLCKEIIGGLLSATHARERTSARERTRAEGERVFNAPAAQVQRCARPFVSTVTARSGLDNSARNGH